MSILIPGMKMPKDCRECPFFGYTAEDDFICLIQNGEDTCRLEELPPHGRLIDADALGDFPYNIDFCDEGDIQEWIDKAETIIPAEGGDTDAR